MIRGEDSQSIPIDLIIEILSRLPAKSIARFRCVSKLWCSMFLRPYFTELFLTRSSPRLLFAIKRSNGWFLYSSPQPQPQPQNLYVLAADFHIKLLGDNTWLKYFGHDSGLIYFRNFTPISEVVICNPSTGQYANFFLPKSWMDWGSYLGFDPIDKQYKVLFINQILTLGTKNGTWRKIHCPIDHIPTGEGICINGVLYYLAGRSLLQYGEIRRLIVCFDVRSEKFEFIVKDFIPPACDIKLINYKGKLGVITLGHYYSYQRRSLELCMWVIKDVEKPESSKWLKYPPSFWDDRVGISMVGVTATGEIVMSTNDASKPFYVFFFDPERNTLLQSVEIKGLGANNNHHGRVHVFVDHVENLKFITTTGTTSGSSKADPKQEHRRHKFESISKFDSLRLLDDDESI